MGVAPCRRRPVSGDLSTAEGNELSAADSELAVGLARWWADRYQVTDPVVTNLRRPAAGYSSETVFVDVTWSTAGGSMRAPTVVRMAPVTVGTFADYDLESQWQAQQAAAGAGVPVADPHLELDVRWIGAPFIAMPRVEGHVVGAVAHKDRWLGSQIPAHQALVQANLLSAMARCHQAATEALSAVPRRDNGDELDYWEEYLDWSSDGDPVPALVSALQWCRQNQPADPATAVLLWGDARLENTVFGDDLSVRAVLDWDMTSIGAPQHDLAWFTSLDFTAHRLFGERTAGFVDRDAVVALFEELSGHVVSDLEWYETLAMVRSTAIMTRIGYLRRGAGQPLLLPIDDNPLLDLLTSRLV